MITKEDCVLGTRVALTAGKISKSPFIKGYVAGEYIIHNNKESVIIRRDTGGVCEFFLESLTLERDILVEEALLKAQYTQAEQAWEDIKPEMMKRTKEATKLIQEVCGFMEVYKKSAYHLRHEDPLLKAIEETKEALRMLIAF